MSQNSFTRRHLLAGLGASGLLAVGPLAANSRPALFVLKDRECGCCSAWIEIMTRAGFAVTSRDVSWDDLVRIKLANGIGEDMVSCHTAEVGGYLIEGHVPPADVLRLLAEQPDALGLAVPDMPYGSPGMGPESEREAYDVYLMGRDGQATVFATYDAA